MTAFLMIAVAWLAASSSSKPMTGENRYRQPWLEWVTLAATARGDQPADSPTLAAWIRQRRRAGLYEQGRALYEKGGLNLERLTAEELLPPRGEARFFRV